MGRRIIAVFKSSARQPGERLGTLTVDPEHQYLEWRPYRSTRVEQLRLFELVRLLEWKFPAAARVRAAADRRRRRRKASG